jgi:hypothetical protein
MTSDHVAVAARRMSGIACIFGPLPASKVWGIGNVRSGRSRNVGGTELVFVNGFLTAREAELTSGAVMRHAKRVI